MGRNWREFFDREWRNPRDAATRWKQAVGAKVIGGTLPDMPEEIVHASGALPQNLLGHDIPFHLAESHLQNFACPYTRTILEMIENKEFDYLDGIIVPHACDATRCLDLVLKRIRPFSFVETLYLPKYSASESARTFYREELNRIRGRLADFTGRYPDAELVRESIALSNRVKDLLSGLKDLLKKDPPLISAAEYFAAVRAAMVMPKEEIVERLDDFLAEARTRTPDPDPRPAVVLAGKIPEPPSIIEMIENSGLRITEDTLVIGARYVLGRADIDRDPLDALIARQLSQIPFTGIWDNRPHRAEYIIEQVRAVSAQGVVILVQKFCEPYEIEVPGLRFELEQEHIPSLILESEFREDSLEPLRTRVQAFAEMLEE
jgi:bcr-type benzoyl-CoA reductase subunit C